MSSFAADQFKATDFLGWSEESQTAYIRNAVGMAVSIATLNDKDHSKCMQDWYTGNEQESQALILKAMKAFSDYHPRGVLIAVLSDKCGSFRYSAR